MERYKIQMKAFKKSRLKINNTPFLPRDGKVMVMDTLDPGRKIPVKVLRTATKSQRLIIKALACPVCKNHMFWDGNWEAFTCEKHGTKAIYEVVK